MGDWSGRAHEPSHYVVRAGGRPPSTICLRIRVRVDQLARTRIHTQANGRGRPSTCPHNIGACCCPVVLPLTRRVTLGEMWWCRPWPSGQHQKRIRNASSETHHQKHIIRNASETLRDPPHPLTCSPIVHGICNGVAHERAAADRRLRAVNQFCEVGGIERRESRLGHKICAQEAGAPAMCSGQRRHMADRRGARWAPAPGGRAHSGQGRANAGQGQLQSEGQACRPAGLQAAA